MASMEPKLVEEELPSFPEMEDVEDGMIKFMMRSAGYSEQDFCVNHGVHSETPDINLEEQEDSRGGGEGDTQRQLARNTGGAD